MKKYILELTEDELDILENVLYDIDKNTTKKKEFMITGIPYYEYRGMIAEVNFKTLIGISKKIQATL